ncbi:MAG: arginine--tRNA ligase [Actinomycetota bacterium]|nr:arginine--tRNA ligase [Actinomycetota bacterium]
MITDQLTELVERALEGARAEGEVAADPRAIEFERPRNPEHGDWSTNVALALGRSGANPRQIADALVRHMPASDLVAGVEVAGPGFLNFRLAPAWLHDVVRRAADPASSFGRGAPASISVNVEYVSANPTGRINVITGRHAAVGDTIANLLEATGHDVTREYYFNDAGRQMNLFARSVAVRYLQHFGRDGEIPEEGYVGQDVIDLAVRIAEEHGDSFLALDSDALTAKMLEIAVPMMLAEIRTTLDRFGTRFDVWFSESKLHDGEIDRAIEILRDKGYIDDREGAVWFRATEFGDDKDRVVIRSNGEPTYFAADLGYLLDKFERGFDKLIYLWGADHHGTVPRFMASVEALGFDKDRVEVPLVQIVSLLRGDEVITGSKRAGVVVPLDELIDEIGVDAARYTYLTRSLDAHLEFDVEAVKQQAPENPVYYVQYAHARICSILVKAAEEGAGPNPSAGFDRLSHPSEDALMRRLASFEEVVPEAAQRRAPQRITRYLEGLAADFSAFYRDCRVVSEDGELTQARLTLCIATRRVLADGLALLGVSAPERM